MTKQLVIENTGSEFETNYESESLDELDYLIAKEDPFEYSAAEVEEMRLKFIKKSVAWHLQPGTSYADYAERRHFSLTALKSPADILKVPLLPSMLFKRANVNLAHPLSDDFTNTTSSGTKGSVSNIPRDDQTLRRFFSSIGNLSNELLDIQNPDIYVFNLGPDTDEAKNLWISYVMAGTTVLLPKIKHYILDGTFLIEDLLIDLQEAQDKRILLIGPPPLLMDLAQIIKRRRISLKFKHENSLVVSIGGWKKRNGEKVEREVYDAEMSQALSLPQKQIRDSFNMVELNTVLLECEHKNLHIPPWLSVSTRKPADLSPQQDGEEGILAFLDPTATSFPGFVLSDDIGVVNKNVKCQCGRSSDTLKIIRRLNTMEARGCALKLDGFKYA